MSSGVGLGKALEIAEKALDWTQHKRFRMENMGLSRIDGYPCDVQ